MHQLRYKIGKRAKEKRAEVEARQRETRRSGSAPKRNAPNWNRVKMEVAEVKRAKLTRVKAERANVARNRGMDFRLAFVCIVLIALSRCRLRLCHSHTVYRREVREGDREGPNGLESEV